MKTRKTLSCFGIALALALGGDAVAAPQANPQATASAENTDLIPIPPPDISAVDPPVQAQIKEAQLALINVMERPNSSDAERADAYGALGQIYQAYDFGDAALACYANASRFQPKAFRWPYLAGYLHQRTGDSEAAERDLQKSLAAKPDNVAAMLRLGGVELTLSKPDEAQSLFSKALAADPNSAPALYGLGKVALIQHQFPAALEYFKKALALDPKASSIHYQLAMTYRGLGDMPHMQEELKLRGQDEPTILDPNLDQVNLLKQGKVELLDRGSKAFREGRLNDAVAAYRQMAELYPSDAIVRTYLGVALAKSGEQKEALEQYQIALQLNPNNATADYNMGVLLVAMGRETDAITHFREAVRIDPNLADAHFQLANLLMRERKDEEAGREYAAAVSIDPQNGFGRLMQAMAAVQLGDYAQARSILEQAAIALPKDPDIANALARILAAAPVPAVRDEKRALEIVSNLVQHQQGDALEDGITLAMALASVGQFQQAAKYQQSMIANLEQAGRPDLARALRPNLALYQQGKPCRVPWAKNDPIFTPVPNTPGETKPAAAQKAKAPAAHRGQVH